MPRLVTTEDVPEWAVPYLEYGEPSGLLEEEQEEIDEWLDGNFPNGYVCEYLWNDTTEFNRYPLFGKPCRTIKTNFYEP